MFGIGKKSSTTGTVGRAAKPGEKVDRRGIPVTTPKNGKRVVAKPPKGKSSN